MVMVVLVAVDEWDSNADFLGVVCILVLEEIVEKLLFNTTNMV